MSDTNYSADEMTVKLNDRKASPRVEKEKSNLLVDKSGDLIVNPMDPQLNLPKDIDEKAQKFIKSFHGYLKDHTEAYIERMVNHNGQLRAEASEHNIGGYSYWNALTIGPIQFTGNPPYAPNKIIAAGELTLMLGVVWINPAPGPSSTMPGTTVLGDRDYRVRFESINLTDVVNGPEATFTGVFPSPAGSINLFPWFFVPADPGPNPKLYETILTADISTNAQPFAAFSTWHYDLDQEPAFLGRPTRGAEWQYDIPARFMVYRR
jgi:hypothetical protein